MLRWDREAQFDSVFDKASFGANRITVYKFNSRDFFQMWFHMDEKWILSKQLEAKNFEDAHEEAVAIVRDYLREKSNYWANMYYDLWKAEDWVDEEDDG